MIIHQTQRTEKTKAEKLRSWKAEKISTT